jgi:hypothetical protein
MIIYLVHGLKVNKSRNFYEKYPTHTLKENYI